MCSTVPENATPLYNSPAMSHVESSDRPTSDFEPSFDTACGEPREDRHLVHFSKWSVLFDLRALFDQG